ncbi:ribonuclease H-like domain-containing protein, partial [Tanacetum coccineum]
MVSNQQHGVDFDETFSPVVKSATIHTVLSLVVSRQWPIHQLDVKNAFLNGDLSEKCICISHLAPRAWFQRFTGYATRAGFSPSQCDSLLFIYTQGSQIVDSLHKEFDMTDLGALNYFLSISVVRHPTVQQFCLYMHDPRESHFAALKRILRYVLGYTPVNTVFLGDNLLSWYAKRQHTISRSSAEAEYRGVANVVAETVWIRNLLHELHSPLLTATLVYCDNVSAVYMSANPVQHQRTKHIEIDIHFVRDMVKAGHVRLIIDFLVPLANKKSARSLIAKLIWKERNDRLFSQKSQTPNQVTDSIISTVRLKLMSCRFKKTENVEQFLLLWKIPSSIFSPNLICKSKITIVVCHIRFSGSLKRLLEVNVVSPPAQAQVAPPALEVPVLPAPAQDVLWISWDGESSH